MNGYVSTFGKRIDGMRVLCFSHNPENYGAANYQQEFLDELGRQSCVTFYGPGFPNFDPALNADDVSNLIKRDDGYDCIVTAHMWISEVDGRSFPCPRLDLSSVPIPKIGILNKEYQYLTEKLAYYERNNFDLILSHHHDVYGLVRRSELRVQFWPFAADERKVVTPTTRVFDLGFSGVLRNEHVPQTQANIRRELMKEIFWTIGDLPIARKPAYRKLRVAWNAMPRQRKGEGPPLSYRLLKQVFRRYGYKRFSEHAYFEFLAKTRLIACTLSPLGLISPRMYEAMASGCVVICEDDERYGHVFPEGSYVALDGNPRNWGKQIADLAHREDFLVEIASKGRNYVRIHHTWSVRVRKLIREADKITLTKCPNEPKRKTT